MTERHECKYRGDKTEVVGLDADTEKQERERDVCFRQSNLTQSAGESQPVQ